VFGAGGQGREAVWFARSRWGADLDVVTVVDDEQFLPTGDDTVALLDRLRPQPGDQWVAAVGDVPLRRRAAEALSATGMTGAQVVHETVDLSAVEHLGRDVIVSAGAVLSVGTHIADHVHVNVGVTVSHDVLIGEYATLSPGVHVAGWVDIRPGAFIGTGASIINGSPGERLVIGAEAVVAAGACVLGSVEPGSLYAGVPARRKR
jgi:sugar O-acyltransferase (sialic acid O-acetyltransferase NeuD family)